MVDNKVEWRTSGIHSTEYIDIADGSCISCRKEKKNEDELSIVGRSWLLRRSVPYMFQHSWRRISDASIMA
jgi:hypothetical protein